MPTYEYECPTCAHRFEKFQGINETPVRTCPECGGQVRRLLGTGAGIIVKGSGSSGSAAIQPIKCGKGQTCCGREERCEKPPCS